MQNKEERPATMSSETNIGKPQ